MDNTSSSVEIALWQRRDKIYNGEETVPGSRITRKELRYSRNKWGIEYVKENYPWIPLANILEA